MGAFAAVGGVMLVIGLLMAGGAFQAFARARGEKRTWHSAQGIVLLSTWTPETFFRPIVEFTTRGGRVIRWKQPFVAGWNFAQKGARVEMLYDPNDPRRARFERGGTFGFDSIGCLFLSKAVSLTGLGLCFLVIGSLGMCIERAVTPPASPPGAYAPLDPNRATNPAKADPRRPTAETAARAPTPPAAREPLDGGEAWVVGARGALLHCAGSACRSVDSEVPGDLHAIAGFGKKHAWAVGDNGVVLSFDGTRWKRDESGVTTTLLSVWARTIDDVWVAGDGATLLRYDGRRWARVDVPSRLHRDGALHAVHGSAPDDVWVTTASRTVLQFDGRTWTERGSFPSGDGPLRALAVFSPKYVLLANGSDIMRWDGAKWSSDGGPGKFAPVAFAMNDAEPWACGGDSIERRIGGRWEPLAIPDLGATAFSALAARGAAEAWAVGPRGSVVRYSDLGWRRVDSKSPEHLAGVWAPQ